MTMAQVAIIGAGVKALGILSLKKAG